MKNVEQVQALPVKEKRQFGILHCAPGVAKSQPARVNWQDPRASFMDPEVTAKAYPIDETETICLSLHLVSVKEDKSGDKYNSRAKIMSSVLEDIPSRPMSEKNQRAKLAGNAPINAIRSRVVQDLTGINFFDDQILAQEEEVVEHDSMQKEEEDDI